MSEFLNSGLKILTVTGGEPLLYPKFNEFIEWISDKVEALGVISNATKINDSTLKLFKNYASKILFQTSLNGEKEYHDKFTGVNDSYEKVLKNVKLLVESGIRVRLTININEHNIEHIQSVAQVANELGVFTFSTGIPHNIGREKIRRINDPNYKNLDPDNNLEMVNKVIEKVKYVREKYPNLFKEFNAFKKIMDFGGNEKTLKPGEIPETFACGAGRSSVHLDSKGNIQLCAISESCGFPSFGNILNNSLEKVMSTKIAKLSSISPAPTPKFCSVSCKNFFFCGGCIARGYNKFLKEKENCSWGQKFYN